MPADWLRAGVSPSIVERGPSAPRARRVRTLPTLHTLGRSSATLTDRTSTPRDAQAEPARRARLPGFAPVHLPQRCVAPTGPPSRRSRPQPPRVPQCAGQPRTPRRPVPEGKRRPPPHRTLPTGSGQVSAGHTAPRGHPRPRLVSGRHPRFFGTISLTVFPARSSSRFQRPGSGR
jgi:hypothetical protein